ncbi:hypothetical protein NUW58_g2065 [Xylaria curta]|uniref:Uncharacterized protein n=1 Tax=Xylaria curta TaxID=42375 RepID=A0ACC1PHA6_9PEZI|nr:hypothetical protein NUW58_g2065 [Xylaria curta]
MYTIGLVSGDPGASAKEMKAGLIGRLDDWILYEEAWNVAEQLILERTGITSQLFVTIEGQIKQRNANIARWKEMREEVEKRPDSGKGGHEISPDQTTQEETEVGEEEETDEEQEVLSLDLVLSSEEDEEGGGNGTEKEEGEEGGKDGGKEDEEKGGEKNTDPWDKQLTEESIQIGCILLQGIIQPKLPNAGNYLLDWREERRRRHWFNSLAYARLTGSSEPEWTHKSPFDPFAADGPPNYRKLPRKTVWDRLQYMWVLTWWRCYQLRELEL